MNNDTQTKQVGNTKAEDERFSAPRIIRSVILFTVAGVALYGAATLASDYHSVASALFSFPFSHLITVIVLVVVGWMLRAWRFHYYLIKSSEPVGFWYSTAVFFSGFALTGTPGKIGEAVKGVFLKQDYGTAYTKVMGIVMMERLMDLWGMLVLASFSLLLFSDYHGAFVICAIAVIGGGAVLSMERLYRPLLEWTGRFKLLHWISEKVLSILLTGRDLMKPSIFAFGLIVSAISWGMESLSLYVIMQGLNLPGGILEANFVYSFSTLVGALSMMPGGIGGTEAGMIGLMRVLGISYQAGLPAVILIRVCTLWMAIFVGIAVILVMLGRGKKES